jgi:hypothetical protein
MTGEGGCKNGMTNGWNAATTPSESEDQNAVRIGAMSEPIGRRIGGNEFIERRQKVI